MAPLLRLAGTVLWIVALVNAIRFRKNPPLRNRWLKWFAGSWVLLFVAIAVGGLSNYATTGPATATVAAPAPTTAAHLASRPNASAAQSTKLKSSTPATQPAPVAARSATVTHEDTVASQAPSQTVQTSAQPPRQPAPAAAPAPTVTSLNVSADVSDPSPADYTTETITVDVTNQNGHPVSGATIDGVAHYRTTDHPFEIFTGSDGVAGQSLWISRATPGYQVEVDVTASYDGLTGSGQTSYTPVK